MITNPYHAMMAALGMMWLIAMLCALFLGTTFWRPDRKDDEVCERGCADKPE